jgi:PIN domain nuclease of toxin-antitoxin system
VIHLDTHVVVWLFAGEVERFPAAAREALEREALAISPIVLLELQYLHEIGRLAEPGSAVVQDLAERLGLSFAEGDFAAVAAIATGLDWTRDPFDRLIAAHAIADDVPLLTADRTLRDHVRTAFWEESGPAPRATRTKGRAGPRRPPSGTGPT